jgi:hypothetical protein
MITILFFLFFLGISPAKAETNQCLRVKSLWKLFGQTTTTEDCCKQQGVVCDSFGDVIKLYWGRKNVNPANSENYYIDARKVNEALSYLPALKHM